MIGRALLKIRQTFKDGVQVAWYRDVIRKRILRSAPARTDDISACEIHVLTSADDWLNLMWTLKSFYLQSGRHYGLCIHDDGTLPPVALSIMRQHFPDARVISRKEADTEVLKTLETHPRCRDFRINNHLSPKVFDFLHFLRADRMLLLDSDVLFFSEPTELLHRIEDPQYTLNSVNGDVASAYTVDPEEVFQRFGVNLTPRFNSGLGVIHRESLRLDWIEEFLTLTNIQSHFWRIEQTIYALCSSRFGVELLPTDYDVFTTGLLNDRPSRHYVGEIRHLLYSEGIRRLYRDCTELTQSKSTGNCLQHA